MKKFIAFAAAAMMLFTAVPAHLGTNVSAAQELPNPVALYEFNNAVKPGRDTSGNGNHLVSGGDIAVSDGKLVINGEGGAAAPNDTNGGWDENSGSDFLDKLTKFTVSAEITLDSLEDGEKILFGTGAGDWKSGFRLKFWNKTLYLSMGLSDGTAPSLNAGDKLASEFWKGTHRYTVSYDDSTKNFKVYVDDALVMEGSKDNYVHAGSKGHFTIGALTNNGSWWGWSVKSGAKYEYVVVYGDVLTDDQVKAVNNTSVTAASVAGNPTKVDMPDAESLYLFNNAENPGLDFSGKGHDLVDHGDNLTAGDGKLTFTGDGIGLTTKTNNQLDWFDALTSFTVSAKITINEKLSGGSYHNVVFSSGWNDWGGGFCLIVKPGEIALNSNSGFHAMSISSSDFYKGTHTYTVTYDKTSGKFTVYVDGIVIESWDAADYDNSGEQGYFCIGSMAQEGNQDFCTIAYAKPVYDHVVVYGSALTEAQVNYIDASVAAIEAEMNKKPSVDTSDAAIAVCVLAVTAAAAVGFARKKRS